MGEIKMDKEKKKIPMVIKMLSAKKGPFLMVVVTGGICKALNSPSITCTARVKILTLQLSPRLGKQ